MICGRITYLGLQDRFSEGSRLTNCQRPSRRLIRRMHFFFSHCCVRLSFEVIIFASLNVALHQIPEHIELSACVCVCLYAWALLHPPSPASYPTKIEEKQTHTYAAFNRLPQISAYQVPCFTPPHLHMSAGIVVNYLKSRVVPASQFSDMI